MKQASNKQSKQMYGSSRHGHNDWAELERELRRPVATPDEALCDRIMAGMAQGDGRPGQGRSNTLWSWRVPRRTVAALGAAAALVALIWLQPWGESTQDGAATTAAEADHPDPESDADRAAIRKEQELMVKDTRKITAFLQANLQL